MEIIVVQTSLYHYDLYKRGVFFTKKIGSARVDVDGSEIHLETIYSMRKHREQLGAMLVMSHQLYQNVVNMEDAE